MNKSNNEKLEKRNKNEKKELERHTHMRKELASLTTAAKDIKDEHVLERNGFTITRKKSKRVLIVNF